MVIGNYDTYVDNTILECSIITNYLITNYFNES